MVLNRREPGFLWQMVQEVHRELEKGVYEVPDLRVEPPPGTGRLASALLEGGSPGLMVELKHTSPGYREGKLPALGPERFLEVARAGGAQAVSVIPQPFRFGGSLEEFARVARQSPLPVLFKDFVLDLRQVRAAARLGARAVLLLARLEREGGLASPLAELAGEARQMGLEVVVEVHQEADLPAALALHPDLLGVNARDLETLELDRDRALRTLSAARGHGVPLVGMSGIAGPEEVFAYRRSGADAVLVGTRFLEAEDPEGFLRSLRPVRRPEREGS